MTGFSARVATPWRAFANGDLYLDAARCRLTVRASGSRFALRCNSEFIALFDTIDAAKADAEARAAQLRATAVEEDAWYASWPKEKAAGRPPAAFDLEQLTAKHQQPIHRKDRTAADHGDGAKGIAPSDACPVSAIGEADHGHQNTSR